MSPETDTKRQTAVLLMMAKKQTEPECLYIDEWTKKYVFCYVKLYIQ